MGITKTCLRVLKQLPEILDVPGQDLTVIDRQIQLIQVIETTFTINLTEYQQ